MKQQTKVTIDVVDKPKFDSLQQWLTIKNDGKPVSQAEVIRWLLSLGLDAKDRK